MPARHTKHRRRKEAASLLLLAVGVVLAATAIFFPAAIDEAWTLAVIFISAIALAVIGIADDVHPIAALPRLFLQAAAIALVMTVLPDNLRALSVLPWWVERILIFGALLWFVNAVNFMDGIDWMTVTEVVPVTAGLAVFGLMGVLPAGATLVALGLCGAMIGFAPFNKPVAQIFLGDVGSLPIGLLLGWLLVLLGGQGHLIAAILLPLYYLADATVTLLRRFANGEAVMQPHRSHFYQRALDNGLSVYQIVGRIFVVNAVLAAFAAATIFRTAATFQLAVLAAGCALVATLLWTFSRVSA